MANYEELLQNAGSLKIASQQLIEKYGDPAEINITPEDKAEINKAQNETDALRRLDRALTEKVRPKDVSGPGVIGREEDIDLKAQTNKILGEEGLTSASITQEDKKRIRQAAGKRDALRILQNIVREKKAPTQEDVQVEKEYATEQLRDTLRPMEPTEQQTGDTAQDVTGTQGHQFQPEMKNRPGETQKVLEETLRGDETTEKISFGEAEVPKIKSVITPEEQFVLDEAKEKSQIFQDLYGEGGEQGARNVLSKIREEEEYTGGETLKEVTGTPSLVKEIQSNLGNEQLKIIRDTLQKQIQPLSEITGKMQREQNKMVDETEEALKNVRTEKMYKNMFQEEIPEGEQQNRKEELQELQLKERALERKRLKQSGDLKEKTAITGEAIAAEEKAAIQRRTGTGEEITTEDLESTGMGDIVGSLWKRFKKAYTEGEYDSLKKRWFNNAKDGETVSNLLDKFENIRQELSARPEFSSGSDLIDNNVGQAVEIVGRLTPSTVHALGGNLLRAGEDIYSLSFNETMTSLKDVIGEGVDLKTAQRLANDIAAVNTLLEVGQLVELGAGSAGKMLSKSIIGAVERNIKKKLPKKLAQRFIKKNVSNQGIRNIAKNVPDVIKEVGSTAFINSLEEGIQDFNNEFGQIAAKHKAGASTKETTDMLQKALKQSAGTVRTMFGPSALLAAFGRGVRGPTVQADKGGAITLTESQYKLGVERADLKDKLNAILKDADNQVEFTEKEKQQIEQDEAPVSAIKKLEEGIQNGDVELTTQDAYRMQTAKIQDEATTVQNGELTLDQEFEQIREEDQQLTQEEQYEEERQDKQSQQGISEERATETGEITQEKAKSDQGPGRIRTEAGREGRRVEKEKSAPAPEPRKPTGRKTGQAQKDKNKSKEKSKGKEAKGAEGKPADQRGAEAKPVVPPGERAVGKTDNLKHEGVYEVDLNDIEVETGLKQFKEGADPKTGVVEPLAGKFERTPVNPVVVMQTNDGTLLKVTGSHRIDLARRSGEKTIPAQVLKESEGFTMDDARKLDAEANIRDQQGSFNDYVTYFRAQKDELTEKQVETLTGRQEQRDAFLVGKYASDNTMAALNSGDVTRAKAIAISRATEKAEQGGLKGEKLTQFQQDALQMAIDNPAMNAGNLEETLNFMRSTGPMKQKAGQQMGLFAGTSESAKMNFMKDIGKVASKKIKDTKRQLSEYKKHLDRLTNKRKKGRLVLDKKTAREEYGITDINNPKQIKDAIDQINSKLNQLENWPKHKKVRDEIVTDMVQTGKVAAADIPEGIAPESISEPQYNRKEQQSLRAKGLEPLDPNTPLEYSDGYLENNPGAPRTLRELFDVINSIDNNVVAQQEEILSQKEDAIANGMNQATADQVFGDLYNNITEKATAAAEKHKAHVTEPMLSNNKVKALTKAALSDTERHMSHIKNVNDFYTVYADFRNLGMLNNLTKAGEYDTQLQALLPKGVNSWQSLVDHWGKQDNKNVQQVYKALHKDGELLTGHEAADVIVQTVLAPLPNNMKNPFKEVLGRPGGDEIKINGVLDVSTQDIESRMETAKKSIDNIVSDLGLQNIPHPKSNYLPFGTGIDYGIKEWNSKNSNIETATKYADAEVERKKADYRQQVINTIDKVTQEKDPQNRVSPYIIQEDGEIAVNPTKKQEIVGKDSNVINRERDVTSPEMLKSIAEERDNASYTETTQRAGLGTESDQTGAVRAGEQRGKEGERSPGDKQDARGYESKQDDQRRYSQPDQQGGKGKVSPEVRLQQLKDSLGLKETQETQNLIDENITLATPEEVAEATQNRNVNYKFMGDVLRKLGREPTYIKVNWDALSGRIKDSFRGVTVKDNAYIDIGAKGALEARVGNEKTSHMRDFFEETFSHEITHVLHNTRPEVYNRVVDAFKETWTNQEREIYDFLRDGVNPTSISIKEANNIIDENGWENAPEMVATKFGSFLNDPQVVEMINDLSLEDQNSIVAAIKEIIRKIWEEIKVLTNQSERDYHTNQLRDSVRKIVKTLGQRTFPLIETTDWNGVSVVPEIGRAPGSTELQFVDSDTNKTTGRAALSWDSDNPFVTNVEAKDLSSKNIDALIAYVDDYDNTNASKKIIFRNPGTKLKKTLRRKTPDENIIPQGNDIHYRFSNTDAARLNNRYFPERDQSIQDYQLLERKDEEAKGNNREDKPYLAEDEKLVVATNYPQNMSFETGNVKWDIEKDGDSWKVLKDGQEYNIYKDFKTAIQDLVVSGKVTSGQLFEEIKVKKPPKVSPQNLTNAADMERESAFAEQLEKEMRKLRGKGLALSGEERRVRAEINMYLNQTDNRLFDMLGDYKWQKFYMEKNLNKKNQYKNKENLAKLQNHRDMKLKQLLYQYGTKRLHTKTARDRLRTALNKPHLSLNEYKKTVQKMDAAEERTLRSQYKKKLETLMNRIEKAISQGESAMKKANINPDAAVMLRKYIEKIKYGATPTDSALLEAISNLEERQDPTGDVVDIMKIPDILTNSTPNYKEMSSAELQETIANLKSAAGDAKFLWEKDEAKKQQQLENDIRQISREMTEARKPPPPNEFKHSQQEKAENFLNKMARTTRKLNAEFMLPEYIVDYFTGWKGMDSALYKAIWDRMNNAENQWFKIIHRMSELSKEIQDMNMVEAGNKPYMTAKFLQPDEMSNKEHGLKHEYSEREMTLNEMMFFYAHSQSEAGMAHLRGSGFADETISDIVANLPQDYKNKVDMVIDYYTDEIYPLINEVFRKEHGVNLPKADRYFPIMSLDHSNSGSNTVYDLLARERVRQAGVKKDRVKARVGSSAPFKSFDFFGTVGRTVQEQAQYIAFREPVMEANKILNDQRVKNHMREINPQAYEVLMEWLGDAARGKINNAHATTLDDIINFMRRHVNSAFIMYNPRTAIKQLASYVQGSTEMEGVLSPFWKPALELGNTTASFAASRYPGQRDWVGDFIKSRSQLMSNRENNMYQEFMELWEKNLGEKITKDQLKNMTSALFDNSIPLNKRLSILKTTGKSIGKRFKTIGFLGIRTMDGAVTRSLWLAKYKEQMRKYKKQGYSVAAAEERAIKEADKTIRTTQPHSGLIHMPHAYRRYRAIAQAYLSFTNQTNKNWNNIYKHWDQAALDITGNKKLEHKLKAMGGGVLQLAAWSVLPGALLYLADHGRWPDPKDDPEAVLLYGFENFMRGIGPIGQFAVVASEVGLEYSRANRGGKFDLAPWATELTPAATSPLMGVLQAMAKRDKDDQMTNIALMAGLPIYSMQSWQRAFPDTDPDTWRPRNLIWSDYQQRGTGITWDRYSMLNEPRGWEERLKILNYKEVLQNENTKESWDEFKKDYVKTFLKGSLRMPEREQTLKNKIDNDIGNIQTYLTNVFEPGKSWVYPRANKAWKEYVKYKDTFTEAEKASRKIEIKSLFTETEEDLASRWDDIANSAAYKYGHKGFKQQIRNSFINEKAKINRRLNQIGIDPIGIMEERYQNWKEQSDAAK